MGSTPRFQEAGMRLGRGPSRVVPCVGGPFSFLFVDRNRAAPRGKKTGRFRTGVPERLWQPKVRALTKNAPKGPRPRAFSVILEPRPTAGGSHRWTSSCLPRPSEPTRASLPSRSRQRNQRHTQRRRKASPCILHTTSLKRTSLHSTPTRGSSHASGMPSSRSTRHARRAVRTPQRLLHAQ